MFPVRQQVAAPHWHGLPVDAPACDPAQLRNRAHVGPGDIYEGTAASGQVHVEDRPPCGRQALTSYRIVTSGGARFPGVRQFGGSDHPPLLKEALERNTDGVFRSLQDTLRQTDAPLSWQSAGPGPGLAHLAGRRASASPIALRP